MPAWSFYLCQQVCSRTLQKVADECLKDLEDGNLSGVKGECYKPHDGIDEVNKPDPAPASSNNESSDDK